MLQVGEVRGEEGREEAPWRGRAPAFGEKVLRGCLGVGHGLVGDEDKLLTSGGKDKGQLYLCFFLIKYVFKIPLNP